MTDREKLIEIGKGTQWDKRAARTAAKNRKKTRRTCARPGCKRRFVAIRVKRYCSQACRQAAYRMRHEEDVL